MTYAILLISPGRWQQAKTQEPIGVVSLVIIHVNGILLALLSASFIIIYYLAVFSYFSHMHMPALNVIDVQFL